jgi:hypothetical protein
VDYKTFASAIEEQLMSTPTHALDQHAAAVLSPSPQACLTFTEAARSLPGLTGHLSINTIHRWATKGLRGVRLQSVRIGARLYTTREWLEAFVRQVHLGTHHQTAPVPHRPAFPALVAQQA